MGSDVVVEDLPLIAPLKTAAVKEEPGKATDVVPEEEEEEGCVTPKGEEHVIKAALVCPPAPRKPRPAKRKAGSTPSRGFHAVPRDLASVFLPIPCPPKKRIRVGYANCVLTADSLM